MNGRLCSYYSKETSDKTQLKRWTYRRSLVGPTAPRDQRPAGPPSRQTHCRKERTVGYSVQEHLSDVLVFLSKYCSKNLIVSRAMRILLNFCTESLSTFFSLF
ncbi:hypothetical protein Y032_0015g2673 [Ancylostoma ceylanicum]|uniref:Uncharacterized protein n=1 Tax=Ancylostoma ceylanicum TaxID=53326 RepID=A0A016V748_9BILA|nr:hypothetical protein Y032_0015g2673 [Ancylostoma ceylanicum]